jgi:hypothetical protein
MPIARMPPRQHIRKQTGLSHASDRLEDTVSSDLRRARRVRRQVHVTLHIVNETRIHEGADSPDVPTIPDTFPVGVPLASARGRIH